jgi:ABC-type transporter Mla subunit MlaD
MAKRDFIITIIVFLASLIPAVALICLGINPFKTETVAVFSVIMMVLYLIGLGLLVKPLLKVYKDILHVILKADSLLTFEEISERVQQAGTLKDIFQEYKKTLRAIDTQKGSQENPGQIIKDYYSTIEAEFFFNEDTLIINNIAYKTINYLPQILTAIGLLGTFLGIVQGVHGLNIHMDGTSMQEAIPYLLQGVEVSFVTSLFGISFSLSLTLLTRHSFDLLIRKINVLVGMINGSLNKSVEKEGLKELEKQLEMQTASMQKLGTDLSEEMGRRFDTSLQENLSVVSEKLNELISEIQKSFESSLIDKISPALERLSIVSEYLGNMQKTTTDRFMRDTLSKMEEIISSGTQNELQRLEQSMEIMISKNQEFMGQFSAGIEKMEDIIISQESLVERTNDSASTVFLTADNLKQLQQGIDKLLSDVHSINANHDVSIEELQSVIARLNSFSLNQNAITEELAGMVQKTYELGRTQENYAESFAKVSATIHDNVTGVTGYIRDMTDNMRKFKDDFGNIQSVSLQVAEELGDKFQHMVQGFENTSRQLNYSLQEIESKLISRVEISSEKIANITSMMEEFYLRMDELSERFEAFAKVEESTQNLWAEYRGTFEELQGSINEGIINYTELVRKSTEDLFNHYDENIAVAVNHLRGMVEIISSQVEDVGDTLEEVLENYSGRVRENARVT